MYRLGGQEAPPNIICVYLGDAIASMLRAVEEGTDDGTMKPSRGTLDLGLSSCRTSSRSTATATAQAR